MTQVALTLAESQFKKCLVGEANKCFEKKLPQWFVLAFAQQKANGKPAGADLLFVCCRMKMSTNNYYIVMGGYVRLAMNER